MFLNFLKKFLLKRKLKKALSSMTSELSDEKIKTVGLIIDETYFTNKSQVVEDLQVQGIAERNINLLLYHDKDKKRDLSAASFSMKNVSWSGVIDDEKVVAFEAQRFDLLISYYDLETPALLWVTQRSKARFKVGFSTIDKRLNHLMIQTTAENNTIFIQELFKYLKILNKI
jgi:hypothetical protein